MSTQHFGDTPTKAKSKDTTTLIERILNRVFKKREIVNCDNNLYLHRWYVIRNRWFGVFIHKFVRSDEDRALHDHPWNFIVIPIWRGYIEHHEIKLKWFPFAPFLYDRTRVMPILGTRFRRAEYKHRVELIDKIDMGKDGSWRLVAQPSWSIFIRFRARREWGFHTATGWIQWNKWWSEKCE